MFRTLFEDSTTPIPPKKCVVCCEKAGTYDPKINAVVCSQKCWDCLKEPVCK